MFPFLVHSANAVFHVKLKPSFLSFHGGQLISFKAFFFLGWDQFIRENAAPQKHVSYLKMMKQNI